MSEAIIVAIISAASSILVQLFIVRTNNQKQAIEQAKRDQKLDDRLEHIDSKLAEHNKYSELFADTKEAIVALQKDVEWLRKEKK